MDCQRGRRRLRRLPGGPGDLLTPALTATPVARTAALAPTALTAAAFAAAFATALASSAAMQRPYGS